MSKLTDLDANIKNHLNDEGQSGVIAAISALIAVIVIVFVFLNYVFPAFEQLPGGDFITNNKWFIITVFALCIIGAAIAVVAAIVRA